MVSQNADVDSLLSDVQIPHISRHGLPVTSLNVPVPRSILFLFIHSALRLDSRASRTMHDEVDGTADCSLEGP